jgi:hypothetical protein
MALHFSHSAVSKFGYGPDDRPILIAAFLDRWSKMCGGPDFHFGDAAAAGTKESPPSGTKDSTAKAISGDDLHDAEGTMATKL